jgi:hypothetical protein
VKKKSEGRLVSRIEFILKDGQTLYVDPNGLFGPGLNRVFVTYENGKVEVFADATSGSHFRFSRGSGKAGDPDFKITNLTSAEGIEDILKHKFWSQFTWGKLIAYLKDKHFCREVQKQIKKLVGEFESHAAEELNAIPRPSSK